MITFIFYILFTQLFLTTLQLMWRCNNHFHLLSFIVSRSYIARFDNTFGVIHRRNNKQKSKTKIKKAVFTIKSEQKKRNKTDFQKIKYCSDFNWNKYIKCLLNINYIQCHLPIILSSPKLVVGKIFNNKMSSNTHAYTLHLLSNINYQNLSFGKKPWAHSRNSNKKK